MSSASCAQGCPDSDGLSTVVDGSAPEEIAVHVESCARCQRQVALLRRVDVALRRRMAPPVGLSERIKQTVREGASREPLQMPRWWMSPALRLAAAVAVTAAAIAVLVNVLGGHAPAPTLAAQPADGRSESAVAAAPAPVVAPATGTLVEGPTLRLARAGGGVAGGMGPGAEVPQGLPSLVRHVWTVSDLPESSGHLKSVLPKGSYQVAEEDGNTVFTMVLADRELQKLVDGLADRRWQLVSPDLPQPKRQSSVILTGHDVRYSLVMVKQP